MKWYPIAVEDYKELIKMKDANGNTLIDNSMYDDNGRLKVVIAGRQFGMTIMDYTNDDKKK